jgi:hypothetical protein
MKIRRNRLGGAAAAAPLLRAAMVDSLQSARRLRHRVAVDADAIAMI